MDIVSPTPDFNFKTISLADPQPLQGSPGFYFTQLHTGAENKALCLQLPECLTKQGVVPIKNGKYLDLMFERAQNDVLLHWLEQLEYTCQDIIDAKKELWFQTELTRDDIETMMTQLTRLYQSGKYMLMRVFVETAKGNSCIAYDENEIGFDLDVLEPNKPIIPLIQIEGVKFSSRSFEISLKLVQVMVMGKLEKKSTCLIKRQHEVAQSLETTKAIEPEALVAPAPAMLAPTATLALAPTATLALAPTATPALAPAAPALAPTAPAISKPAIRKEIEEITIDYDKVANESIILKNPNDVYYELYKKAREKAKQCRIAAIEAYLEAKQIKTKYMLYEEDDSDDDISEDDISDDEN
jgi:hypothetical protein